MEFISCLLECDDAFNLLRIAADRRPDTVSGEAQVAGSGVGNFRWQILAAAQHLQGQPEACWPTLAFLNDTMDLR